MLVKKNLCKPSIIKPLCAIYYCNNSTEIVITSCWFVWDWPVTEFTFFIFIYDTLLNLHSVFCTALLFFCCSMSAYSMDRERCHCFFSSCSSKPPLVQIHPPDPFPAAEQPRAGGQHCWLPCPSVQLKTSQEAASSHPPSLLRSWTHGIICLKPAQKMLSIAVKKII